MLIYEHSTSLLLIDTKRKILIYEKNFQAWVYSGSELKLDSIIVKRVLLNYTFFTNRY